jgi:hypothetical protein
MNTLYAQFYAMSQVWGNTNSKADAYGYIESLFDNPEQLQR